MIVPLRIRKRREGGGDSDPVETNKNQLDGRSTSTLWASFFIRCSAASFPSVSDIVPAIKQAARITHALLSIGSLEERVLLRETCIGMVLGVT